MRFVLEDYANSLPEYTANKLIDKVVRTDSWIRNLQEAMDLAIKIDQESRQVEVMRSRRYGSNTSLDTTSNTTVNEVSLDLDVNYIASKQGDSNFNSTMKPGHRRESKEFSPMNRSHDSSRSKPWQRDSSHSKPWQNDSSHSKQWQDNRRENGHYNNSYRKINKYRHPAREPRHNIKFEYALSRGENEILRVLSRMVDYLKGKTDREVESIKNMLKINPRGINEVREDQIATITINEIQRTLKEDVNIVYDALVASDFIEESTDA